MMAKGAVLHHIGDGWKVEEYETDRPGPGEVTVEWKAAGLCHSDEHMRSGDRSGGAVNPTPPGQILPILGGHEGAGVVSDVGSGVVDLAVGDHVAAVFLAPCGVCEFCATGRQYLCLTLRRYKASGQLRDGVVRHRHGGSELQIMSKLGTFGARTVVSTQSVVKIDPSVSFAAAALVSCGVATGWGAAVDRAGTVPGDVVVIVGVGGLGIAAVQGARCAGASSVIAVDPLAARRVAATEFGATHAAASLAEAKPVVDGVSEGRGAERVVVTVGAHDPAMLRDSLVLLARGGVCVYAGLGRSGPSPIEVDLYDLAMASKEIRGCVFGALNPTEAIPRLLRLYRDGALRLDEMMTAYPLEGINDGYADMLSGRIMRGVLVHD